MLFNSYIFIFLFLPLALLGWYGLNRIRRYRAAQIFLIGMSLWFYAYFCVRYLVLILISAALNYTLSFLLALAEEKSKEPRSVRRTVRIAACLVNLGLLGYFKYYDFLIENLNAAFSTDFNLRHILLPLGISFFTFQQMSYVFDRCRGSAPHYGIVDYLTFVTFFPQLVAGPIVMHSELVPQFQDVGKRKLNYESFAHGIIFFVIGLSKKVLLADLLAAPANFGFANIAGLDSVSLAMAALAYMFQLYFDFSGYCDMACGISAMFGIRLPDNFNSPYRAVSIRDFWRRWHMTLGRFFTTYVYIPLGGSRRGRFRTIVNTMIVFTLSGLWHGANWTFVLWGMLHGLAMALHVLFPIDTQDGKKHFPAWALTFCFNYFAWIIFRADSIADAGRYLRGIFACRYFHSFPALAASMKVSELYIVEKLLSMRAPGLIPKYHVVLFGAVLVIGAFLLTRPNTRSIAQKSSMRPLFAVWLAFLFAWSVISLSGVSTFLYFNF